MLKRWPFHLFLWIIGFFILFPIIWVFTASFIEATQTPYLVERILKPESLKSKIDGNKITFNYKVHGLSGEKTYTFGSELANHFILIFYDNGSSDGSYEEKIAYDAFEQAPQLDKRNLWLLSFKLDANANIEQSSYKVNRKVLLNFFNILTFENYRKILWDADFRSWLSNSVIVAVVTGFISVFLGFFAAYSFSRFRFPGRKVGLMWVLATQLFPLAMMLVPFYILASVVVPPLIGGIDVVNTLWGLILIYTATALPFSIWMLKGYFDTIPIDLEEAAAIDGASIWQLLGLILLPLTRPALFTAFLFAIVQAWNEYVIASLFMTEGKKYTLPLGLRAMLGNNEIASFAAAAVVVSIPIILMFLFMKKELVEGATMGAVKG